MNWSSSSPLAMSRDILKPSRLLRVFSNLTWMIPGMRNRPPLQEVYSRPRSPHCKKIFISCRHLHSFSDFWFKALPHVLLQQATKKFSAIFLISTNLILKAWNVVSPEPSLIQAEQTQIFQLQNTPFPPEFLLSIAERIFLFFSFWFEVL